MIVSQVTQEYQFELLVADDFVQEETYAFLWLISVQNHYPFGISQVPEIGVNAFFLTGKGLL